jgi:hypothetical protein
MATITIATVAGEAITIDNPYMDQVAAIDSFVTELTNQLTAGPVMLEAIIQSVVMIPEKLMDIVVSMGFEAITDALSFGGVSFNIPIPPLPILGPIPIPPAPEITANVALGEEALLAMGAMTESAAMEQFVADLVESVSSEAVLAAVQNILEKVIKEDLPALIMEMAQSALDSIVGSIPGLEIGELAIPVPPGITLPIIPSPIKIEPTIQVPEGTAENITIESSIGTIGEFQAELMAPKLYDTVNEWVNIATSAFTELESVIVELLATEFMTEITVNLP